MLHKETVKGSTLSAHELTEHLITAYDFKYSYSKGHTVKGYIDDVKIDCVAHQYPNLKEVVRLEGLRF